MHFPNSQEVLNNLRLSLDRQELVKAVYEYEINHRLPDNHERVLELTFKLAKSAQEPTGNKELDHIFQHLYHPRTNTWIYQVLNSPKTFPKTIDWLENRENDS